MNKNVLLKDFLFFKEDEYSNKEINSYPRINRLEYLIFIALSTESLLHDFPS